MVTMSTVIANGGATVAPDGSEPTDGYAVAVSGYEWEAPDGIDASIFDRFVAAYLDVFGYIFRIPSMHLGIWHDVTKRRFVLDIAEIYADRDSAINVGTARGEQAIYDLAGQVEIWLGREPVPASREL